MRIQRKRVIISIISIILIITIIADTTLAIDLTTTQIFQTTKTTTLPKGYFQLYLTNLTGTELNKNITILTNQSLNITSKALIPADANITLFIAGINSNKSKFSLHEFA